MGQAAVDLPDPLNPPPLDVASADDLLSQLAGQEIDRLLAEEDVAAQPVAPIQFPEPPEEADPIGTPPTEIAATASAIDAPPIRFEDAPDISDELNSLLGDLAQGAAAEAAALASVAGGAAGATPTAQPVEPPVPSQALPAGDFPEHTATSAAERGALEAPATLSTVLEQAVSAGEAKAQGRLPIYLLPLAWLNAPLEALPDSARELIGKIAILTAVNAVSILVYVLFFRHH